MGWGGSQGSDASPSEIYTGSGLKWFQDSTWLHTHVQVCGTKELMDGMVGSLRPASILLNQSENACKVRRYFRNFFLQISCQIRCFSLRFPFTSRNSSIFRREHTSLLQFNFVVRFTNFLKFDNPGKKWGPLFCSCGVLNTSDSTFELI